MHVGSNINRVLFELMPVGHSIVKIKHNTSLKWLHLCILNLFPFVCFFISLLGVHRNHIVWDVRAISRHLHPFLGKNTKNNGSCLNQQGSTDTAKVKVNRLNWGEHFALKLKVASNIFEQLQLMLSNSAPDSNKHGWGESEGREGSVWRVHLETMSCCLFMGPVSQNTVVSTVNTGLFHWSIRANVPQQSLTVTSKTSSKAH